MSRDLLAIKLNSIETLIGAETAPPINATDKLGWHLDNIKNAIESGGTGGSVQKEYVDNELEKKIDKVTETSANPRLYGVQEDGTQTTYFATQTSNANTVVQRDATGRSQIEDGIAPKQIINKGQLDAAVKELPKLDDTNTFTGQNIFTAETVFSSAVEFSDTLKLNDTVLTAYDTVHDTVTTYSADEIVLQADGNSSSYNMKFPKASGTFALTKFSTISSFETSAEDKEDAWSTSDPNAAITIYHEDSNAHAGIAVQKGFVELSHISDGTGQNPSAAKISIDSLNNITMDAEDSEGNKTTLAITPTDAKINNKDVITSIGGIFEQKPEVKTNGENSPVAVMQDLQSYVPIQSEEGLLYAQVNNEKGQISFRVFRNGEETDKQNIIIAEDRITTNGVSIATENDLFGKLDKVSVPNQVYGTDEEGKQKLYTVDAELSLTSTDLVQNKVIREALDGKLNVAEQSATKRVYARTDAGTDTNISYTYSAEADTIAYRSSSGTLAVETPTQPKDAANKEYVDSKIPAALVVDSALSDSSENAIQNKVVNEAMNNRVVCQQSGNLLKAYCTSPNNVNDVCVVSNTGTANSITRYTGSGQVVVNSDPTEGNHVCNRNYVNGLATRYGSGLPTQGIGTTYKTGCTYIDTTTGGVYVLTKSGDAYSWQLQTTFEKPSWKNIKPENTSKILFTKVTLITQDSINFPGMNGKSVLVQGYSSDGFNSGTVVCDELSTGDITFSPSFIGSISSTKASGVMIKGSNSIVVTSITSPEITFSYEYLW